MGNGTGIRMNQKARLSDPISLFILGARSFTLCYLHFAVHGFFHCGFCPLPLPAYGQNTPHQGYPSTPPMPILEKSNKRDMQATSFIKRCSGENGNSFLTIGHKLSENTILGVLFLVYILFRLIFILNLYFPYITCNFTQK